MKSSETLMTVPQAAEILQLSPVRVRQLCQTARIGKKVGSRYVLTASEVRRFAELDRPPGRKPGKFQKQA